MAADQGRIRTKDDPTAIQRPRQNGHVNSMADHLINPGGNVVARALAQAIYWIGSRRGRVAAGLQDALVGVGGVGGIPRSARHRAMPRNESSPNNEAYSSIAVVLKISMRIPEVTRDARMVSARSMGLSDVGFEIEGAWI